LKRFLQFVVTYFSSNLWGWGMVKPFYGKVPGPGKQNSAMTKVWTFVEHLGTITGATVCRIQTFWSRGVLRQSADLDQLIKGPHFTLLTLPPLLKLPQKWLCSKFGHKWLGIEIPATHLNLNKYFSQTLGLDQA